MIDSEVIIYRLFITMQLLLTSCKGGEVEATYFAITLIMYWLILTWNVKLRVAGIVDWKC